MKSLGHFINYVRKYLENKMKHICVKADFLFFFFPP